MAIIYNFSTLLNFALTMDKILLRSFHSRLI